MKWLLALLLCGVATAQERRSGFDDMARETQAMQSDDSANPGMLWVLEGEALWAARLRALPWRASHDARRGRPLPGLGRRRPPHPSTWPAASSRISLCRAKASRCWR